ncbi:hypothetical protein Ancab_031061 [Ancistrocladus abbreviatus]
MFHKAGPTYYEYWEAPLLLVGLISLPSANGYIFEIYVGTVYDVVLDPSIAGVLALINAGKVLILNPNHDPNVGASKWLAEISQIIVSSQNLDVVLFVLCYHLRVRWPVIGI